MLLPILLLLSYAVNSVVIVLKTTPTDITVNLPPAVCGSLGIKIPFYIIQILDGMSAVQDVYKEYVRGVAGIDGNPQLPLSRIS
jgi:hypothetical protein